MSSTHQTGHGSPAFTPFGAIEGTHWIETLADGSPVLVRPLRPDDRQRETDFINRLSGEACRFRFLGGMKGANPALIDSLMNVDARRRLAFVALAHDNGELREVGVSRYAASADDKHCECAVTVADDWRHRGLAVLLMRRLIEAARKNGFRQMFSIDAPETSRCASWPPTWASPAGSTRTMPRRSSTPSTSECRAGPDPRPTHHMTSHEQADPSTRVTRPGDILALATSARPWSPAVTAGMSIAARWGSNITGCFIDPALRTHAAAEPTVLGLLLETRPESADELAAFGAFARQAGVHGADWTVARSGIADTLRWLGARHDLAVIERDMVQASGLLDVLGEAILACRMPCLILPPDWNREIRFERIVVGCNGSIEAIRAIHAALPFLRVAKQVTLVDGDVRDGDEGRPRFDPFVYLLRHGIASKPSYVRSSSAMAGEILLQEVGNIRADLLVMGAYGRSRMRERVFGGATRRVLEDAAVPVLMQH